MTLEELIAEVGPDKAAIITAALQAEKDRGVSESRKKGEEVKKLLTLANRYKDVLRGLDLDPESDDLETQLETVKKNLGNGKQVPEYEKQLKALTARVDKAEKDAAEKTQRLRTAKLTQKLQGALASKLIDGTPEYIIDGLITKGRVKVSEDDETVLWNENGTDIDFDKGVESWLKSNPSLVKNVANAGGGSAGSGKPQGKTMKRDAWDNLPAREKASFFKDGGQLID